MQTIEIVATQVLTEEERIELIQLEEDIQNSFYQVGKALATIREKKLYREQWKTFEEYVKERWRFNKSNANYKIAAANIIDVLMTTNSGQILPTSETQCRELSTLTEAEIPSAWSAAVERHGGKIPPARVVKDVVREIKEKIKERLDLPPAFGVGEVCKISVKGNPELRGFAGCWSIVKEIKNFAFVVQTWKGEYIVREENLSSHKLNCKEQEEFQRISDRISTLYQKCADEYAALNALEGLAKINRPYLTSFEEKLLLLLEES